MKMPIILRVKHEEIANSYERKIRIKDKEISNLTNENAKAHTNLISKDVKINNLEKEIKELRFCLDACKKESGQITKDNINVMRTLNMNKEIKRQIINIINGNSDVTFNKQSILELAILL